MSILVDENTKVLVIGITGRHGSFQTKKMLEYGTKIVGLSLIHISEPTRPY